MSAPRSAQAALPSRTGCGSVLQAVSLARHHRAAAGRVRGDGVGEGVGDGRVALAPARERVLSAGAWPARCSSPRAQEVFSWLAADQRLRLLLPMQTDSGYGIGLWALLELLLCQPRRERETRQRTVPRVALRSPFARASQASGQLQTPSAFPVPVKPGWPAQRWLGAAASLALPCPWEPPWEACAPRLCPGAAFCVERGAAAKPWLSLRCGDPVRWHGGGRVPGWGKQRVISESVYFASSLRWRSVVGRSGHPHWG